MPTTRSGKHYLPPDEANKSELPSENEGGPSTLGEGLAGHPQGSESDVKRQKRSNSPSPEGSEPDDKPSVPGDEEDSEVEDDEEELEEQEEPETPLAFDPRALLLWWMLR